MDDLPKRYVTAIKLIRILKYSIACKKFHEAKRPIDIKDVVKENTQMNNRLSIMLNDVQRRLDFALGSTRTASYLPDEQKRQLSLSARIEKAEVLTNQFESKLTYVEKLAMALLEKTWELNTRRKVLLFLYTPFHVNKDGVLQPAEWGRTTFVDVVFGRSTGIEGGVSFGSANEPDGKSAWNKSGAERWSTVVSKSSRPFR